MIKIRHGVCLCAPMEMYDILDGALLSKDKVDVLVALKKYLILFCMATPPDDIEILDIQTNYNMATYDIFITSSSFPVLTEGSMCALICLTQRDTIRNFFQGLS